MFGSDGTGPSSCLWYCALGNGQSPEAAIHTTRLPSALSGSGGAVSGLPLTRVSGLFVALGLV